jgi:Tfp pilus assembly protein PilP
MKKSLLAFTILCGLFAIIYAQQEKTKPTAVPQQQIQVEQTGKILYTYDPAGRRDPFQDLLAGRDVKEDNLEAGISEMSIDDIALIGILELHGKPIGIIKGPQGFPYRIYPGDKFEDGFVLSVDKTNVVFRKTRDRGIPLSRPEDITKEINPEER